MCAKLSIDFPRGRFSSLITQNYGSNKAFSGIFPSTILVSVCVCVCGVSPAVVRGTLCHFLLSLFPSFRRLFFASLSFFPSPSVCLSNLICGNFFAIFRHHPLYPVPIPIPWQLLVLCPLMFGNLFECQQLFLSWGGGLLYPKVYHVGYSIGKQFSRL